ncbi:MAG: urease accessory UreF family protein [Acidobacteriaceae bacterium]
MSALGFLQLLHLADSALPVGAAAHSFGLEGLVVENGLEVAGLFSFFQSYLEEAGRLEAVFVYAGYDAASAEQWQRLNEQLSAMKPARETREASLRLGKRLGALAVRAWAVSCRYPGSPAHLPLLFGHVGSCLGSARDEVVAAFLHQSLSGLVSACQRLLPLGQSDAASLLWRLKPMMVETLAAAQQIAVEDVCLSQPLLDLASSRHPDLHTRLFIS